MPKIMMKVNGTRILRKYLQLFYDYRLQANDMYARKNACKGQNRACWYDYHKRPFKIWTKLGNDRFVYQYRLS